jgi:hypothetical protein
MTEEPLIMPYSPGDCLARLSQIRGALERYPALATALPAGTADHLSEAGQALVLALESGDGATTQRALSTGQNYIAGLYEAACQPGLLVEKDVPEYFAALGFPNPLANGLLSPINVKSVVATYTTPTRQVLTTLSFDHAPGAKAYRLITIRHINGEDVYDDTITSLTPVFRRMRVPVGQHRMVVESRDESGTALSPEFTITVPEEV